MIPLNILPMYLAGTQCPYLATLKYSYSTYVITT